MYSPPQRFPTEYSVFYNSEGRGWRAGTVFSIAIFKKIMTNSNFQIWHCSETVEDNSENVLRILEINQRAREPVLKLKQKPAAASETSEADNKLDLGLQDC